MVPTNEQLLSVVMNSEDNRIFNRCVRYCAIRDRLGVRILFLTGKIDVSYDIDRFSCDRYDLMQYQHLFHINIINWIEIIQLLPYNKSFYNKAIRLVGYDKVFRYSHICHMRYSLLSATPIDESSVEDYLLYS